MSLQFFALELYPMSLPFFCYRSRCSSQLALCPVGVLVGGTRQRCSAGTNFKPRKLPENAARPTSRVHAVLGAFRFSLATNYYFRTLKESQSLTNRVYPCAEGFYCISDG